MDLGNVIGSAAEQAIQKAGKIVFHTVGDTGGIHNPEFLPMGRESRMLDG